MKHFNIIITMDTTTGWHSKYLCLEHLSGAIASYTVRATTGTNNTNLDLYLIDRISEVSDANIPPANAAAEFRVIDDTTNVPSVSATEKFFGDVLTTPMPFQNGLKVFLNASGGSIGHYVISVRGYAN